jgi:arylsulfatase A
MVPLGLDSPVHFMIFFCPFLIPLSYLLAFSVHAAKRPDVVLILADDLGWAGLPCYGNDLHQTPHLDNLAKQGVCFTDAYAASPACTPAFHCPLLTHHS